MTTREFLISSWPVHADAVVLALALIGAFCLHRRTTGEPRPARAAVFSAAILLYLLTLNSPLDVLANGYLFSAHMLQHLLLLLVIPALLLLAWGESGSAHRRPNTSLADARRHRAVRLLAAPPVTWLAGVGAMWFWHVPTFCSAATSNSTLHSLQAVSLLAMGTLFWLPILGPGRQRIPPLTGVLYLFTACVGCTLLGIAITFAPVSVCPVFMHPVDRLGILRLVRQGWGLTPAVDQQIGGLLMWVPACFIYASGIVALLVRWYATAAIRPAGATQVAASPSRFCQ